MDVRFVDHPRFQRAALRAALGGAALAAVAPAALLLPATAAGCALGLALDEDRKERLPSAILCLLAAVVTMAMRQAAWPWLLCGALVAVVLSTARAEERPSIGARVAAAIASAAAAWVAAQVLPGAAAVFASAIPAWAAYGAAGAALGLWFVLASAPLHVVVGVDAIEAKLAALRPSLAAEVRALAERAAAARRGFLRELPAGARADMRALIDSLCGAALELAGRTADLGRAAPAALETDLIARSQALARNASGASDDGARQSYLRAAEALQGQLEHVARVRLARERALARLHEEVANLERARFSLTMLHGAQAPETSVEIDLLRERLAAHVPYVEVVTS